MTARRLTSTAVLDQQRRRRAPRRPTGAGDTSHRAVAHQERARLARELHDSVCQALFSITLQVSAAQRALDAEGLDPDGPLGRSVAGLGDLARGARAELRAVILDLRPEGLAEVGLSEAVRARAAADAAQAGIPIRVTAPPVRIALTPQAEDHLYRITCEALHNIVKHSYADTAEVTICVEGGRVTVTVRDDGAGFEPLLGAAGCLGLGTMARRAAEIDAQLTVTSTPGGGTTLVVTIDRRPELMKESGRDVKP